MKKVMGKLGLAILVLPLLVTPQNSVGQPVCAASDPVGVIDNQAAKDKFDAQGKSYNIRYTHTSQACGECTSEDHGVVTPCQN